MIGLKVADRTNFVLMTVQLLILVLTRGLTGEPPEMAEA